MIPPLALRALHTYVRYAPVPLGKPWLAGHLLNEHLREHPVTAMARTRDGAVFPMVTSDVIQRYLYLFGVWEPHLTAFINRRLAPGDTFIDVGANIGYYSVLASRLVGASGQVVAVEASPDFHRVLTANALAGGCGNVRTVNAAVSDVPGRLAFYLERSTNLGGTTSVRPSTVESWFETDAAPLPSILTAAELTTARLIKVDVEGAEASAVRGLAPQLHRLRADTELVIEVTPRLLAKQGQAVDDVLDPLREHGFHVYRLANDYDPATYPTALRRPTPPERWRGPVTEMTDLVLSRVDAEQLT